MPGIGALTFEKPDLNKFPCLDLAYKACQTGETLPAVLNAANEMAVQAFLKQRIPFVKIPEVIGKTMESHTVVTNPAFDDIIESNLTDGNLLGYIAVSVHGSRPENLIDIYLKYNLYNS